MSVRGTPRPPPWRAPMRWRSDLAAARAALESEQVRSRELERAMADRAAAAEAARSRVEEALRESERYQSESRTLRDSLAARDASIAKVLHSLGERDAQLSALRAEHAKIVPALEATSISTSQLEAELRASACAGDRGQGGLADRAGDRGGARRAGHAGRNPSERGAFPSSAPRRSRRLPISNCCRPANGA